MRVAYLVPGNGGQFYCENCLRDAAYLGALRQAGHELLSVPLYLPLSRDQGTGPRSPLFFGAVSFYLRESVAALRSLPAWARRLVDSPPMLALAARQAGTTSARGREDLTLAMLRGDDPVFLSEAEAVAAWLKENYQPDLVHVSNLLLVGLVPTLRRLLGVPVVVSLQDEHTWLDSCRPDKAAEAWEVIRAQAPGVAAFLPVSRFYRDAMADRLGLGPDRFTVVSPGIDLDLYPPRPEPARRRIGFLSHWSEAMGLGLLVEAFVDLRRRPGFDDVGLVVCGGGTPADRPFLRRIGRRLRAAGLGDDLEFRPEFTGEARRRFLAEATVLSVPSTGGEALGAFVIEALASGVPVVQPRMGGFVELVEETGGGLLVEPGSVSALADALAELLGDPARRMGLGTRARAVLGATRGLDRYVEQLDRLYTRLGAGDGEART